MSPAPRREAKLRDVVLATVLPPPGPEWPALADVDLTAFWRRFAEVAPFHLRVGFGVAVWVLGVIWPRLAGSLRSLPRLDPTRRDELMRRAAGKPLLGELLDLVKMVGALAYFDDPRVAAFTRRPR